MRTPEERRLSTEDIDGFRLAWSVSDSWADVKAYQVEHFSETGEPMFERDGGTCTPDTTEALEYLDGYVKWDGCSEFMFDRVHWCGPDGYKSHFALLRHIYLTAFKLMGRDPEEAWDEPTTICSL